MAEPPKPLRFLGSALDDLRVFPASARREAGYQLDLDDLRAFPASARREAGYQLDKVQAGFDPADWKPMNTVGQGVREIRIRDKGPRSG